MRRSRQACEAGGLPWRMVVAALVVAGTVGCLPGGANDGAPGPAIVGTWRYEAHAQGNVYDQGSITFSETTTGGTYRTVNFYGYTYDGTWTRQGTKVALQGTYQWTGRIVDGHRMEGTWTVEGEPATWVTTR